MTQNYPAMIIVMTARVTLNTQQSPQHTHITKKKRHINIISIITKKYFCIFCWCVVALNLYARKSGICIGGGGGREGEGEGAGTGRVDWKERRGKARCLTVVVLDSEFDWHQRSQLAWFAHCILNENCRWWWRVENEMVVWVTIDDFLFKKSQLNWSF